MNPATMFLPQVVPEMFESRVFLTFTLEELREPWEHPILLLSVPNKIPLELMDIARRQPQEFLLVVLPFRFHQQ